MRILRISHDGGQPLRTPVEAGAPMRISVPWQSFDLGSYGLVPNPPALARAVTFTAWVWPTALPVSQAGIVTQGEPGGPFAALSLLSDGRPAFRVSTVDGEVSVCGTASLRLRRWYLLAGGYDPELGARLIVWPRDPLAGEQQPMLAAAGPGGALLAGTPMLTLAACRRETGDVTGNLDSKIDSPAVFDRLPTTGELSAGRARLDRCGAGLAARRPGLRRSALPFRRPRRNRLGSGDGRRPVRHLGLRVLRRRAVHTRRCGPAAVLRPAGRGRTAGPDGVADSDVELPRLRARPPEPPDGT